MPPGFEHEVGGALAREGSGAEGAGIYARVAQGAGAGELGLGPGPGPEPPGATEGPFPAGHGTARHWDLPAEQGDHMEAEPPASPPAG